MGVDCKLLVPAKWSAKAWAAGGTGFVGSVLELNRDRDLWPMIEALRDVRVGPLNGMRPFSTPPAIAEVELDFTAHPIERDLYGSALKARYAGDLAILLTDQQYYPQRAAAAYLAAIDPETPIALWWC